MDEEIYLIYNYEEPEAEVRDSLSSGYTANIENDEDLNSRSADFRTESNDKKNAVWTKKTTMAMLSLYEENIRILTDIGKKSQVWKKISEGLKGLCMQVTADQVKWKFNRLNNKYKECIDNNNKSGRAHMTFEYYEQFEQIFHKEKNVSTPHTFSSLIISTDEKKRKQDITRSKTICNSKKLKIDATSSEKNLPPVKKTARNQQRIQTMEILKNIQENHKARDEKMSKYLEMKEKEMELKKKAIDVRETEMQVKRDFTSEKLKLSEKKHQDWLNIEKMKCELLQKLLKNRTDSEE